MAGCEQVLGSGASEAENKTRGRVLSRSINRVEAALLLWSLCDDHLLGDKLQ